MTNKYLIRLDDACPTMDWEKWQRMFGMLDRYGVRPMVGIIPHNEDPQQQICKSTPPQEKFWKEAVAWQQKGYAIAMHGYNHCYISDRGLQGLNPLWARSEFAGVPLEAQRQKIKCGYDIMMSHGVKPHYFFAPSHTFDENTLAALKECTDIRIISDTVATKPYKKGEFVFLPQLGGHCAKRKLRGVWTFCLHPSAMTDENFEAAEYFLKEHSGEFIGFNELNLTNLKGKSIMGKMLSWAYFTQRRLRGIK